MATRPMFPWPIIVGGQLLVILVVLAVAIGASFLAFVWYPEAMVELVGVVLVLLIAIGAIRTGGSIAERIFPSYNVAEVGVDGRITRDGGQLAPSSPGQPGADQIVEQIEFASADPAVNGLMIRLNTPGGQVVPSDDIRAAIERFDGPTIAYTTDICASGGYWIAAGCDELWAREGSIVGSIGVRGSHLNISELADRLGVAHERFTAGRFKDTGSPFRELDDDERAYLQGLVDDHYDQFIERVTEGRELDGDAIRETEARVYLGAEAHELGLVDEIGDRVAVQEALADRLGIEHVRVREFHPPIPFTERFRFGIERVAYAVGAGVAGQLVSDEVPLPDRP